MRLGAATARYLDALHVADPLAALQAAARARELDTADDRAAVIDWRLPDPGSTGTKPLPWLPGIPAALHDDPHWGAYLTARSDLVRSPTATTQSSAAERSGLSIRTLRRRIANGDLPADRSGPRVIRVDPVDVDHPMVPIPTARA